MKVKELIELLNECDPEYPVCIEDASNIGDVVIHKNLSDPSETCVQIWYA